MSLGRTRGADRQDSIFAGAGGSRVQGLVVLARNAQAFPLMPMSGCCILNFSQRLSREPLVLE
jgi:hypothetical protein